MADEERFQSFHEFWYFYLREHANPITRRFHVRGTILGLLTFCLALMLHSFQLVILALVFGYGFAWYSHFKIEKNRPATFQYPTWSFVADLKLLLMTLTKEIDGELEIAGVSTKSGLQH